MTDAYVCRGATSEDLDGMAPMLSEAFAIPTMAILPSGHNEESIRYRRGELEHWYLQCMTETGRGAQGTTVGQRRLMVVCPKDDPSRPIGFCQYEMVEPGMRHCQWSAQLPPMPAFPHDGDQEQYYLWKDMVYETRRGALGDQRHANVVSMVVASSHRGSNNFARRAISDYCAEHYLAWGDCPNYNDAYARAAPLWERSGYRYLTKPFKTPYRFATHERTEPTKEIALRRGQPIPTDEARCYVTIPQIRWRVADRDIADRMAPTRRAKEQGSKL
ncbi:unnamed protein product [Parajaminaea phylloscopi]